MIICQRCGKENADHYKFCLGCGTELKPRPEAMAKTVMAEPSRPTPSPTPPGGIATSHAAPQRTGAASSPPPQAAAPPQPAGGPTPCPSCGNSVPEGFLFCGKCGTRIAPAAAAAPVAAPPPVAAAPARHVNLTLIRPDGSEGGVVTLRQGENRLGRNHGPVFETDGYLSPEHALLFVEGPQARIRDSGSLNGVFMRIEGEVELPPAAIFRIGQELLRYDLIEAPAPLEDGTEVMGSPNPGYWGRLAVVIGRDVDGSSFPLLEDTINLGRERGDINFPDDGYVSGLHARITHRDGKAYLSDLGSSNGTFVKIRQETLLVDQSFVLLGQQLFRLTL